MTRLVALLILVITAGAAVAQAYPVKPVRLIAWGTGSFPDLVCRSLIDPLAAKWGQPVIVENRPGAGGILAAEAGRQAGPDGHTLVWGDPVGWQMYIQYEAEDKSNNPTAALVPVTQLVDVPLMLFAGAKLPFRTMAELRSYGSTQKQPLFYGTPGKYSVHHLALELLSGRINVPMQHVPYKTMTQIVPAIAAGDIALSFSGLPSIAGLLKEGRIIGLAWSAARRSPAFADVPTFAEAGLPDMTFAIKAGLYTHRDTPGPIVQRISRDVAEALKHPNVSGLIAKAGALAVGSTPEEFAQGMQRDLDFFGSAARSIAARDAK